MFGETKNLDAAILASKPFYLRAAYPMKFVQFYERIVSRWNLKEKQDLELKVDWKFMIDREVDSNHEKKKENSEGF